MADSALSEKLRQVLEYANGDLPDGYPNETTGQRRLVRWLERLVPKFWDLDVGILSQIIEMEDERLPVRVMEADPRALGLEIRRQRPHYQSLYHDPAHREQLRVRNTPFEVLIEQNHPGLLRHVFDFVHRMQNLGLHSEFETKRKTDSVETLHAGMIVRRVAGAENTTILSVSGYGKIICRSVQTGSLKPLLTRHAIALSRTFECPLGYDHEEWLLTSEEMQNIVKDGGYANLEEALARRPDFAPFVSVDIGIALPDRADLWIDLIEQLMDGIEKGVPMTEPQGLRVTPLAKPSWLHFEE